MASKGKMRCHDCGIDMNRHAEKVNLAAGLNDIKTVDQDFGGVVMEFHTCPECGTNKSRIA